MVPPSERHAAPSCTRLIRSGFGFGLVGLSFGIDGRPRLPTLSPQSCGVLLANDVNGRVVFVDWSRK